MAAPDSLVRHRCANGRLQRLVLTASRWADGTPDSEQSLSGAHRTVQCPKARNPIFYFMLFFNSIFVLTCVYVLDCHLALYVSVCNTQNCIKGLYGNILILCVIFAS
jgi:hypothetical protein